jgi:hypothetical protein
METNSGKEEIKDAIKPPRMQTAVQNGFTHIPCWSVSGYVLAYAL